MEGRRLEPGFGSPVNPMTPIADHRAVGAVDRLSLHAPDDGDAVTLDGHLERRPYVFLAAEFLAMNIREVRQHLAMTRDRDTDHRGISLE
jgi:hypothetical protein